jgi:hypothetical protein
MNPIETQNSYETSLLRFYSDLNDRRPMRPVAAEKFAAN